MKVVPLKFYQNPEIGKILIDGQCAILYKEVSVSDTNNERYLSAHALTLVLEGSLQIEYEDERLCMVHKNEVVLLPKGLYMVTDIIPKERTFKAFVFFFDTKLTDVFLQQFPESPAPDSKSLLKISYNAQLQLYVETLLKLYKDVSKPQFAKPKLLELLHLIAIAPEGKAFIATLKNLKLRERKNIKDFMLTNYQKPLDIADYAYLTGRSISTFQRDFKAKFQISPKKWLIQKRLEKAAELLQEEDFSISKVALAVGYENVSHFIKVFQNKFAVSPKQYQINYQRSSANMFF